MRVSYVSDLHLDFWARYDSNTLKWEERTCEFITQLINTDAGKREVLCIAGDLSHYNQQSLWAIKTFAAHYEQVFVQVGNHDYYLISGSQERKYKKNSLNRVKELQKEIAELANVTSLFEGEATVYKGVKFGGTPLWYPLETVEQKVFFNNNSNDSVYIKGVKIQTEHNINQLEYKTLVVQNLDVMISHFPVISVASHFKYNSTACYLTPVKEINVKAWIFGHSHEQEVYEKPYCNFYMNAIGYPHEKMQLKIESFKI